MKKKNARKIMTVLLSVLIIAAFMPVMSFADGTVTEAALTSEQIAAAQGDHSWRSKHCAAFTVLHHLLSTSSALPRQLTTGS
jgi:ABC-type transport system involved in cytochrome c biogenesis permease component